MMKVSKVLGCVLGLHCGVIALLLVQPGCQTSQPPTQTYTQDRAGIGQGTSAPRATPAIRATPASTADRPGLRPVPPAATATGASRATPAERPESRRVTRRTADIDQGSIRSSVPGARRSGGELIPASRAGEGADLDAAFNAGFESGGEMREFEGITPIQPLGNRSQAGAQAVEVSGPSMETYTVKRGDSLWSISRRYDTSVAELYAANGLSENSVLRVGQQIQIPVEGSTAAVRTVSPDTYQPTSFDQGSTSYEVQRGDSLSVIAQRFDTTVRALKAANGKTSDLIRVGETLIVPVADDAPAPSASAPPPSPAPAPAPTGAGATRSHTVRAGEFPATIARQYGMTTGELLALNGITDPRALQVGQVLRVSASGSAANVDSRTETVSAPAARTSPQPAPAPTTDANGPVEIRVIEADPLVEEEASQMEADELFEGAVEIPVIRLED
jgi:LysM repeat protein